MMWGQRASDIKVCDQTPGAEKKRWIYHNMRQKLQQLLAVALNMVVLSELSLHSSSLWSIFHMFWGEFIPFHNCGICFKNKCTLSADVSSVFRIDLDLQLVWGGHTAIDWLSLCGWDQYYLLVCFLQLHCLALLIFLHAEQIIYGWFFSMELGWGGSLSKAGQIVPQLTVNE